jgi:gluconate 5-dehydrogenase
MGLGMEDPMRVQQLFDLSGQVAVVTGGSRGLGLEIAEGLGEAGATVVITARRETWLTAATEELRGRGIDVVPQVTDVTQPDQVEALVRGVLTDRGRIDVLVNNAGISWGAPPETMPLEKWNAVLATNVTGPFLLSRAVLPGMAARGRGKIINVASVAGLVGTPPEIMDAAGYAASKGALISLTRDLAVKWGRHGITVNVLAPGFFPTRMSEPVITRHAEALQRATPLGRTGRAGELKGAALFLASAASDYVTGQVLVIDGGATAL